MNTGKKNYDEISIPAQLDEVITKSMRRAERTKRLRSLRRMAVSAAAVVCVLFASANIMPIYTYASQIPVLGSIVQVLQIGSGGEITDGARGEAQNCGESVLLSFKSDVGELDAVPYYSVTRYSSPNRLMINLVGVRDIDFDSLSESLLETSAVQDAYRMMVLDDSRFGVVIVLNPGWSCEVSEYTDPGALMLSFKEDAGAEEVGAVYYLRTEAMPYTEELGLLCEEYHAAYTRELKTLGGEYIVTLGQYGSESEALEALDALNSKYGDHGLFVASGAENEIPEN